MLGRSTTDRACDADSSTMIDGSRPLSIVVATRSRADRLRALLAALGDGLDVVAVADGATPEVLAVLRDAPVRVVELSPGRGPAAARNAGWRAATGSVVAFTDDDCVPSPGWAAALAGAAGADEDVVVQGPVEP